MLPRSVRVKLAWRAVHSARRCVRQNECPAYDERSRYERLYRVYQKRAVNGIVEEQMDLVERVLS